MPMSAPVALPVFQPSLAAEEALSAKHQALYAKHVRKWSRTDTERWISERSATGLALLRRRAGTWPAQAKQLGLWLRQHQPKVFDRAHAALAAAPDDARREQMTPAEIL